MTPSIRTRLTLWYAIVLSLVLAAFATAFDLIHSRSRLARVDEELARAGELLARLVPPELDEGLPLGDAAADALEDIDLPGRSLAIQDGSVVLASRRWEALSGVEAGKLADGGRWATADTSAGRFRVHLARFQREGTSYSIGVAESLVPLEQELAALRRALLGSVVFALLLAGAGGWWIAHAALRPVAQMAQQARELGDRTPGLRLASPNPRDELGRLASAFNGLLARLETALDQQRQLMADASHELRTPVSVARTALEVTLGRRGRSEEEYRDSLGVVAEQVRRLSNVVEDMFTLARADVAGLPLEPAPLYADELVADCVKEARLLGAEKAVKVEWQSPGELGANGDERRLREMLANLLHNAVRHTPAGGRVRVELVARGGAIELAVADSGPGIPESDRDRIFERFVRLDGARRPGDGAGLGLPIARTIAEAHGGSLILARSDDSGSTFLVRLPRSAAPA